MRSAFLALLLACTPAIGASPKAAQAAREATHELISEAAVYAHPAQAAPPSGKLAKGTRVFVLRDGGSYTEVSTVDASVRGYVETAKLKKL